MKRVKKVDWPLYLAYTFTELHELDTGRFTVLKLANDKDMYISQVVVVDNDDLKSVIMDEDDVLILAVDGGDVDCIYDVINKSLYKIDYEDNN